MKLQFALVSSNDNETYLKYYPFIKNAWGRLNIDCILFKVTNKVKELTFDDNVYSLPLIEGVSSVLQSQIARIWGFKLVYGNCITSDMDMMPMSYEYFHKNIENFPDEYITSYSADAGPKFDGFHPMCYIAANSLTMQDLIKYETWEDFVRAINLDYGGGWSSDQAYMNKIINSYDKIKKLTRGFNINGQADGRLDRDCWIYKPEDKFIDAHLPRNIHEEEMKKLLYIIR